MRDRKKMKGRQESAPFVALPVHILESEQYSRLSAHGVKLLIDLLSQFKGNNNGDLCAAWGLMQTRGWRSSGTLHRALKELLDTEFIQTTRQGGRHKASLYAVTWKPIDDCKGKLDIAPTRVASNAWREKIAAPYGSNVLHMGAIKASSARE